MFGWFMSASACRSDSKRAMTSLVSIPHLMSLSATRAADRMPLLGLVDDAHAALADLAEEPVGADLLGNRGLRLGGASPEPSSCPTTSPRRDPRRIERQRIAAVEAGVGFQQRCDFFPQRGIVAAFAQQEFGTFLGGQFHRSHEEFEGAAFVVRGSHDAPPSSRANQVRANCQRRRTVMTLVSSATAISS